MTSFDGSLRNPDQPDAQVDVVIDLSDDSLQLSSEGRLIAGWRLGEVLINAKPDGFHIRRAGEVVVLEIEQDAEFAVMLDLRSVPVDLARRMAMYRNSLR